MNCTIALTDPSSFVLEPAWKRAALKCAVQHPLIRTAATLRGLAPLRERPQAVALGIGLSSRHTLSRGLPFDVLGMLLPAEEVRRATGAARIVALIADRHALTNGFAHESVMRRARQVARGLEAVRAQLGLPLDIVRAETMHADPHHARIHQAVCKRAGQAHPYVTLEVADTAYLQRQHGPIIKVGWVLGTTPQHGALDERFFDERFLCWVGDDIGFAYCEAGRTLDPSRLKAAPYVAIDPTRRLLLRPDEAVERKLALLQAGAPEHVRRSVRAHLRRITQVYSRAVEPLDGSLVERVRTVLEHIFPRRSLARRAPAGAR
jgi:hypothetical protein